MSTVADTFDPWGPISAVLYEIKDSDFVQNAIANTGIDIAWRGVLIDEATESISTASPAAGRRPLSRSRSPPSSS